MLLWSFLALVLLLVEPESVWVTGFAWGGPAAAALKIWTASEAAAEFVWESLDSVWRLGSASGSDSVLRFWTVSRLGCGR